MSYVSEQLEKLKAKNANEPEFIQAATEVLTSLEPVFEQNRECKAICRTRRQNNDSHLE